MKNIITNFIKYFDIKKQSHYQEIKEIILLIFLLKIFVHKNKNVYFNIL